MVGSSDKKDGSNQQPRQNDAPLIFSLFHSRHAVRCRQGHKLCSSQNIQLYMQAEP